MVTRKQKKALYIAAFIAALIPFLGISYMFKSLLLVADALFIAYTTFTLPEESSHHDTSGSAFEERSPDDTYGA